MARQIAGIGEIVLDIVLRDAQPQAAVPGGSVFNSMISLGRTVGREYPDVKLTMVSQMGNDPVSDIVLAFMQRNGLQTGGMVRSPGQTTVSLAMLDSGSNASYEFFRDEKLPPFELPQVQFAPDDIAIFGSLFAVNPATAPQTREFISAAKEAGAIVYYDINFRRNHGIDAAAIERNIALCDIVRGSNEDIGYLYGTEDAAAVYAGHIAPLCRNFICTRGADDAELFSPGVYCRQPIVKVPKLVSTIGAGDNFNAGVVYALVREGFTKARLAHLSEDDWHLLAVPAMHFSANVCGSLFNYVDEGFAV